MSMMKTNILMIAFTLAGLVGMAQTNQPLPSGAVPFGATTYLSPLDSTIWLYKERDGTAVNLGSWHKVDSLLALKADASDLADFYTQSQIDAFLVLKADVSSLSGYVPTSRTINGKPLTGNVTLTASDVGALTQSTADVLYKPIGYQPAWGDVTGKPSTFPPSAHTHSISDVTGLQSALDGKEAVANKATDLNTLNNTLYPTTQAVENRLQSVASGYYPLVGGTVGGPVRVQSNSTNSTFTSPGDVAVKRASGMPFVTFHNDAGDRLGFVQGGYTGGAMRYYVDGPNLHEFWSNNSFSTSIGSAGISTPAITLRSLAAGSASDQFLTITSGGVVQRTSAPTSTFTVANNSGTPQFTVGGGETWRFNATGDASLAFNSSTKTITINSSGGSTGGGVDSWNARNGHVVPMSGDYTTNMVPESGGVLYHTGQRVRETVLTGFSPVNSSISASDNVRTAFDKTQGQINNRVPTSRSVLAGNHLSGGGALTNDVALSFTPLSSTWITDNQSNNRLYFGNSSSATAIAFRASSTGSFRFQSPDGNDIMSISSSGAINITGGQGSPEWNTAYSRSLTDADFDAVTGDLTLTRQTGGSWSTNFDGRYYRLPTGTAAQYIRGDGTVAAFPTIPTVNNGTLSLSTGAGLAGSASFTANQAGNANFTVSVASGYIMPTSSQSTEWSDAHSRSLTDVSFSPATGNLTLTRQTGGTWVTSLDGRYAQLGAGSTQVRNNSQLDARYLQSVSGGSGINVSGGSTIAVDNTVIRTTGNQTLGGTKTFSSPVTVPNATSSSHAVNLGQLNALVPEKPDWTQYAIPFVTQGRRPGIDPATGYYYLGGILQSVTQARSLANILPGSFVNDGDMVTIETSISSSVQYMMGAMELEFGSLTVDIPTLNESTPNTHRIVYTIKITMIKKGSTLYVTTLVDGNSGGFDSDSRNVKTASNMETVVPSTNMLIGLRSYGNPNNYGEFITVGNTVVHYHQAVHTK